MPPPTPAAMKARHPALALVPDAVVSAALAEAYERSGEETFGPDGEIRFAATMYLAAHIIASDPMAEPSSRSVIRKDGGSTYLDAWEGLLKQYRIFGTQVGVP